MLIEKFNVPSDKLTDVGLKAIEMPKLGHFVVLTGKNGAGKTRILKKLEWLIPQRNEYIGRSLTIDAEIIDFVSAIKTNPPDHSAQLGWKTSLEERTNLRLIAKEYLASQVESYLAVLPFVPKQLSLQDQRDFNLSQIQNSYEALKNPGFSGFESRCFSYIQEVQNREFEATHPRNSETSYGKSDIVEYSKLNSLINLLLKTELGRQKGNTTLFDKPLAEAGLSDGQKILIQLVVALHAQKGKLDNTVFILDEPENHLHPSALIEFLENLAEVAKNSQLWIATHSVPLLAYVAHKEPMSIWYVEDGKVSNAGSKPEQVLLGLLGDDEQIGNLISFASLPAQFAALRFAMECLTNPTVSANGKGDPQVAQIGKFLDFDSGFPLSLLDYGAGKCRLLSGLAEISEENAKKLPEIVNYFAFDLSSENKTDSLPIINSIYGNVGERFFLNNDEFFSCKDDNSIDLVIMCNVMHEITPNEWITLFNKDSLIFRSLKSSGSVLIVEDQRIPVGEKAHKFGFFQLKKRTVKEVYSSFLIIEMMAA
jgi:energy-coupling factor transporter ATP-binding protein EcfA2